MYSNPPIHGARIVNMILNDKIFKVVRMPVKQYLAFSLKKSNSLHIYLAIEQSDQIRIKNTEQNINKLSIYKYITG